MALAHRLPPHIIDGNDDCQMAYETDDPVTKPLIRSEQTHVSSDPLSKENGRYMVIIKATPQRA